MSSQFVIPNIWDIIEKIQVTLQMHDEELSDMLKITLKDYQKLKFSKKPLSLNSITSLAERLNLGIDLLATGNIDYPVLAKHHFVNQNQLPSRYLPAAFSKRRTPICILNYIESMLGWKERQRILQNFQMNEAVFSAMDEKINFLFTSDLCEYLTRYKINENQFAKIGLFSFISTAPKELNFALKDCRSVSEVYEKMSFEIVPKYFEQNFIYKIIKSNKDKCTVSATPNPEMLELLKSDQVGNQSSANFRNGVAAAYPTLIGLPPAIVSQSASIYQGDSEIRYEIDFSKSQKVLSQKSKYRPSEFLLN